MVQYERLLTLGIQHEFINDSQWILLPSNNTEQYLAQNRLRMTFNKALLSIFSVMNEEAPKSRKKVKMEEICFYLFCKDPYFQRASNLPLFTPGREFLFVSISSKKGGSGIFVDIAPARPWLIGDIDWAKKRHLAKPYSIPPCALVHLPCVTTGTSYDLVLDIDARKIYWAYLITPLPSSPELVSIIGGPETFIPKILDNGLLFISKKPISLTSTGYKGISLALGEEAIPLMENLSSPDIGQIQWDNSLKNYLGTVLLDLSKHGVML